MYNNLIKMKFLTIKVLYMEEKKTKTPLWVKAILLILVLQNAALFAFAGYLMERMEQRFLSLEQTVAQTQNIVGEGITSVSQEMEYALSQQASLVSDFYYTLQPAPRGKILLTLSAQLKSYTAGSAAACGRTHELGTLEAGKLADFCVLDRNLLACAPEEVLEAKVCATYVGGTCVFEA